MRDIAGKAISHESVTVVIATVVTHVMDTAIKSMDLMFHVKLRKMMDVGGSEEEDLVPSIKVDASSIAEGTWTCAQEGQGGQVVLCWDNTRSLLRSKVRVVL